MLDLPPTGATERAIITAIRELIQGRNNAVGQLEAGTAITLTAGTSTVVSSPQFNGNGTVYLTPRNLIAAQEVANGSLFVSSIAPGQFTITHGAGAVGSIFDYFFAGG